MTRILSILSILLLPLLAAACTADGNKQAPVTQASAAPSAPQESAENRLLKLAAFVGTATQSDGKTSSVRVTFTKVGNDVLAQYGSTGQVPVKISGNTVVFTYLYGGRSITAQLTLSPSGELTGFASGPGSRGGTFTDRWALKSPTA